MNDDDRVLKALEEISAKLRSIDWALFWLLLIVSLVALRRGCQ